MLPAFSNAICHQLRRTLQQFVVCSSGTKAVRRKDALSLCAALSLRVAVAKIVATYSIGTSE